MKKFLEMISIFETSINRHRQIVENKLYKKNNLISLFNYFFREKSILDRFDSFDQSKNFVSIDVLSIQFHIHWIPLPYASTRIGRNTNHNTFSRYASQLQMRSDWRNLFSKWVPSVFPLTQDFLTWVVSFKQPMKTVRQRLRQWVNFGHMTVLLVENRWHCILQCFNESL